MLVAKENVLSVVKLEKMQRGLLVESEPVGTCKCYPDIERGEVGCSPVHRN